MSKDPELKCFCKTPETCLKKGLFDLFNCVKAPLVASLPHLYLVDESYLEQVDGLHPNKVIMPGKSMKFNWQLYFCFYLRDKR